MSFRFPEPLVLLVCGVLLAAALTHVLPAGVYQRQADAVTGRQVVVAGTYAPVDPRPVGFLDALVAIPRGLAAAADVVFLVLVGAAAFTVVDRTGALGTGVRWLVHRIGGRAVLVIPVISLFFATGGVVENMQEEIIALVPVLLLLTRQLGLPPVIAVAMSIGPAVVGSAFSPINPFQVVIAQQVAGVPRLSGWEYRSVFLAVALIAWIGLTMRAAWRLRVEHGPAETADVLPVGAAIARHTVILGVVGVSFVVLAWGLLSQGWDFNHLTAIFLLMGIITGLIGKLGVSGTAAAFAQGFRDMSLAAVLIGVARAIFVVLDDGRVVDTIVHALFTPIAEVPRVLTGLAMMGAHMLVHVPVPSVSGHAVLTMPVMAPLADLLGMSRQVAVLAYQYGAGIADMVTPTNGGLMAVLAAAGVRYDEWIRLVALWWVLITLLGAAGVMGAVALNVG